MRCRRGAHDLPSAPCASRGLWFKQLVGRTRLLAVLPALTASLGGCDGTRAPTSTPTSTSSGNQAPLARLRYQLTAPQGEGDYPYSADAPASDGPVPGSIVYLSAEGSVDPEGTAVTFFWNVQDPSGAYLTIDPRPDAARVSFPASRLGAHTVTLEVVEGEPFHQLARATLALVVGPHPCAPDGVSPPCADDLVVPGGTFLAGAPPGVGGDSEHPEHLVTVESFALDTYEVTVGRFRRFLQTFSGVPPADGTGANPRLAGSGWQSAWNNHLPTSSASFDLAIASCGGTWTSKVPVGTGAGAGASEARPVSCISWYEAFVFCNAEGKRLPTEAEWEYAAAGGDEQRRYPWGNAEPAPALAVYGCLFDGDPACDDTDLPVAGSLPMGAGRWGHLDLAGSLWEWVFDAYGPYSADPCIDCAVVTEPPDGGRVFRGGDYIYADPSWLTVSTRLGIVAALPDDRRGFRCARTLPP
jgi:formylglycine-generating enzyme required for sulfatase activity